MKISRRKVLATGLAGGAVAAALPFSSASQTDSDNPKDLLAGQAMPLTSARRFLPSLHLRASKLGMKELLIILKEKYQAMTTHPIRENNE